MNVADLLALVPTVIALLALAKRLSGFDLELRSHRARKRRDLLAHLNTLSNELAELAQDREPPLLEVFDGDWRAAPADGRPFYWNGTIATASWEATESGEPDRLVLTVRSSKVWQRKPATRIPVGVLALLDPADAERCAREWFAHLHERVANGEQREARADRRRLVRYALMLAMRSRVQREAKRSSS